MKKVLILISDLKLGGAQKSLISFLNCLMGSPYGESFDIHLMVVDPDSPFWEQVPSGIHLMQPPRELRWLGMHMKPKLFVEYFSWCGIIGELRWLLCKCLERFPKNLNVQQKLWKCWKNQIPPLNEHFDVAISYIDGFPNYYLIDKVQANRKILWFHNEYQKLGYNPDYDRPYYENCHGIITISETCRDCIIKEFPEFAAKTHVLQNITDPRVVEAAAEAGICPEYDGVECLKLLSVGRLNYQKGYDLAINAAEQLKHAGEKFLWLIVGEGPERQALETLINNKGLSECFRLIGARSNPYRYIRNCDIVVQPSRWEGKSIALDEAKCLCKPIVVTNYTTVSDSVRHGETGWIVEMTPQALREGILRISSDASIQEKLIRTLESQPPETDQIINKYITLMLEG